MEIDERIATNHTLNRVGIELLGGRSPSYMGGTISVDDNWLDAIIEGAGGMRDHVSQIESLMSALSGA